MLAVVKQRDPSGRTLRRRAAFPRAHGFQAVGLRVGRSAHWKHKGRLTWRKCRRATKLTVGHGGRTVVGGSKPKEV
jgi:hypothetical protein